MAPLLILLAAMAAKRINDSQAEKRQRQMLDAMKAYGLDQSRKSQGAIEGVLAQQTPDKRSAEMADSVALRASSMNDTVNAAKKSDVIALNAKPNADYQKSQVSAADTVAERSRKAIADLSVMNAPGDVSLNTGIRFGRAAGTVEAANRAIGRFGRATMSDINGVHPNPWVDMMAQAGMAYGSQGMMSGAGGGAAATTSGPAGSGGYDEYANGTRSPGRWRSLWGWK